MSKKITKEAIDAFLKFNEFKKANTMVKTGSVATCLLNDDMLCKKIFDLGLLGKDYANLKGAVLFLFDNAIAVNIENKFIAISHQGWPSATTKERLNALPNVNLVKYHDEFYIAPCSKIIKNDNIDFLRTIRKGEYAFWNGCWIIYCL